MFSCALNAVIIDQKKKNPADSAREEMRFGEGVESNLWFDIGSPWLSVSLREGLSVSPRHTPCCFNEFTKALRIANALVYGGRKNRWLQNSPLALGSWGEPK